MKAILEFNDVGPGGKDRADYQLACNGPAYHSALLEIARAIRDRLKYSKVSDGEYEWLTETSQLIPHDLLNEVG